MLYTVYEWRKVRVWKPGQGQKVKIDFTPSMLSETLVGSNNNNTGHSRN